MALTSAISPCGISLSCLPSSLFFLTLASHILGQDSAPLAQSLSLLHTYPRGLSLNPGITTDFAANASFNALYSHNPPDLIVHVTTRASLAYPSDVYFSFFNFNSSEAVRMIHSISQRHHPLLPLYTHTRECCIFITASRSYLA